MIALGLGARSGVDLPGPVLAALASAGLVPADVSVLASLDRRAGEPRVRELAAAYGWRVAGFRAAELAACPVPHPGRAAAAAVGTPSVAEAAALLAAGPGARLIMPKRAHGGVTVALALFIQPAGSHQGFC
ncbi:cobalamin biosynthesis protein [Actinoplanes sp. G11-F43]|uniref:cobalamin biosynthesis protein n=1 Tax=Actinoplanes sp. G11-F43 TaxID=3424130 RepID=UPI003D33E9E4